MKRIALALALLIGLTVLGLTPFVVAKLGTLPQGVRELKDCKTITWEEEETTFANCTAEEQKEICDDFPVNESCHWETVSFDYRCSKGTTTVQKQKDICSQRGLVVNEKVQLNSEGYSCSSGRQGQTVTVICDSKLDGNGDGICTSGETCTKYVIDGSSIDKYERNSRDDFVRSDTTFFLNRPTTEVLP